MFYSLYFVLRFYFEAPNSKMDNILLDAIEDEQSLPYFFFRKISLDITHPDHILNVLNSPSVNLKNILAMVGVFRFQLKNSILSMPFRKVGIAPTVIFTRFLNILHELFG